MNRREEQARDRAREQEFTLGVGGMDLLIHSFAQRMGDHWQMTGKVPRKHSTRAAKEIANLFLLEWIAGDEIRAGETPQQYADRRFAEHLAHVDSMPFMRLMRAWERRKRKGA